MLSQAAAGADHQQDDLSCAVTASLPLAWLKGVTPANNDSTPLLTQSISKLLAAAALRTFHATCQGVRLNYCCSCTAFPLVATLCQDMKTHQLPYMLSYFDVYPAVVKAQSEQSISIAFVTGAELLLTILEVARWRIPQCGLVICSRRQCRTSLPLHKA